MNRHDPFVWETPGSRCAVLFVHGILGTSLSALVARA